jgi:hypothetical protein
MSAASKGSLILAFLLALVIGIAVATSGSGNGGTDWKSQMFTACADVEGISMDTQNGTLAASDLPGRVHTFYSDSVIGNKALQDGALKMQQAVTAIANGTSNQGTADLYKAGLAESLSACAAVGD